MEPIALSERDKIPKVDPGEVEKLIKRFEEDSLSEADRDLLKSLLRMLLSVVSMLSSSKASIWRLRSMMFGHKSEKQKSDKKSSSDVEPSKSEETDNGSKAPKSMSKPGHGRKGPEAYEGRSDVVYEHIEMKSGDKCADDLCDGKIYKCGRPHGFAQFTGTPIIQMTYYKQEVMRCGSCGKEYEAPLPEGVNAQRWDETADAAIAISKYLTAVPLSRIARVQEAAGIPLSESTQFERCEVVANALFPIYKQMVKEAANATVLHGDDTPVKIRELMKENDHLGKGERKGMQTTGLVAKRSDGIEIILYMSGRNHCGENTEEVLKHRDKNLPPIIRMGDALSLNWPEDQDCKVCKCMVHARRKFVEAKYGYPVECEYVISRIGEIYMNESATSGMSDVARQKYHQTHSAPIMKELLEWMNKEISEKRVEPNSVLGKAIKYFAKNYDHLNGFIKYAGAPIDNNVCERSLRAAVLIRKNSYYYETSYGAVVGGIIQSVLMTCVANKVNVWKYLVEVLRNSTEVRQSPRRYLPWNYKSVDSADSKMRLAA